MGKETILFRHEEKMSGAEAAHLVRKVADKIETGEIVLEQGKKKVTLAIPPRVEVQIKAEKEVGRKKTTMKLELEIEWPLGGAKGEEASVMKIS